MTVAPQPHAADAPMVAAELEVDLEAGLSETEASVRLADQGPNELQPVAPPSIGRALFEAISQPFLIMLAGAGGLAVALGEVRDGLLILLGVIPIVVADVATTYRAERALEVLRLANAPRARVRRSGTSQVIPARDVTLGDVLLLATGDVVAADVRITASRRMLIDRSSLTGESLPEPVSTAPDQAATPLAERRAMAYAGTSVVGGSGEGIVVAIGPDTEVGRIAASLTPADRPRSPMEHELDRLVRLMLAVAISLVAVTVGLGFARGNPIGENLLAGVAAAIAAIPEEPPILLAVILGLGAYRLLRRDVLVRRLNAQETLGAVDLILTDKTGTLTANHLTVERIRGLHGAISDGERLEILRLAVRAEADAWQEQRVGRAGAFARALLAALDEAGGAPNLNPEALVDARPPTDDRPFSQTRCHGPSGLEDLAIGAPEAVLGLVRADSADGLTAEWQRVVAEEAALGGRLLLLATRPDGGRWEVRAAIVFGDPLRPEVPDALAVAATAGIQVIMVTGDHPTTALAVARAAGLPAESAITGSEIEAMRPDELAHRLRTVHVVARATPADKLRLVDAATASGRTVAVTGDGVNDAPALQRADVAVAMGSGTAVAREAADLVLGDDSFATLTGALREGRRIVANVEKGLVFLLSTHVALLGYVLVATLAGFSLPLLPIQILWMELFIDISASVAFEREGEEPGAMARQPRPRGEPLLTRRILAGLTAAGGFSAVAALWLVLTIGGSAAHASWVAFTTLVAAQVVRANANRSLRQSLFGLAPNTLLLGMGLVCLAVQAAIPYLPPLAEAFQATPLSAVEWAVVAIIALAPAVVAEVMRRSGRLWVA